MASKNSKTAADAATEVTPQVSALGDSPESDAANAAPPTGDAEQAPAAEVVPPPVRAAAVAAEMVPGVLAATPVMLHPDSLAQLAELLGERLAPAPAPASAATPAPAEAVQPAAPQVTCRALRPVEHSGVLYGPLAPAGDEFAAAAPEAASLAAIGAIELLQGA